MASVSYGLLLGPDYWKRKNTLKKTQQSKDNCYHKFHTYSGSLVIYVFWLFLMFFRHANRLISSFLIVFVINVLFSFFSEKHCSINKKEQKIVDHPQLYNFLEQFIVY